MERLDKDKILDSLTEDDIIKVVMSLGSQEPKRDNQGNLIFQTICHNKPGADASWKLYYYKPDEEHKRGLFHCYTGCSDSFDILELILRAKRTQGSNFTFYKAVTYLAITTGKTALTVADIDTTGGEPIEDFSWITKLKNAKKKVRSAPQLKEINPNILETFCYDPLEFWLSEGITREALNRFSISYYGLTNQIVIPHFDINGKLIGIRGRYLDQTDVERIGKYVPLQINNQFLAHNLGQNLFGVDVAKGAIQRMRKVMIVESEKACLQSYSMYGDNSFTVGLCGSNITQTQVKILSALNVSTIYLHLDREYHKANSYEATTYFNKLVGKIAKLNLTNYFKVYILLDSTEEIGYKQNAFDYGKDVVERIIDERILVTSEMVREVTSGHKERNA